jgi:hypothetical protein
MNLEKAACLFNKLADYPCLFLLQNLQNTFLTISKMTMAIMTSKANDHNNFYEIFSTLIGWQEVKQDMVENVFMTVEESYYLGKKLKGFFIENNIRGFNLKNIKNKKSILFKTFLR